MAKATYVDASGQQVTLTGADVAEIGAQLTDSYEGPPFDVYSDRGEWIGRVAARGAGRRVK